MKGYTKNYFEIRDILHESMTRAIVDWMQKYNFKKILDVGCGTGQLVSYFNSHNLDAKGCDNSEVAVNLASKINKKGVIFKASATKLPFEDSTFDLVIAVSVIEHLTKNQAKGFLKEARRILKSGGFIFLVTPNFGTPIRLIQGDKWFGYTDPTHINYFTKHSLKKFLTQFGFINIRSQFKLRYTKSQDWEFPGLSAKLPRVVKYLLSYLLFSSPLSVLRNSLWMSGQKNEQRSFIP